MGKKRVASTYRIFYLALTSTNKYTMFTHEKHASENTLKYTSKCIQLLSFVACAGIKSSKVSCVHWRKHRKRGVREHTTMQDNNLACSAPTVIESYSIYSQSHELLLATTTVSMKDISNDGSYLPPSPSNVPTQAGEWLIGISVHYTDTSHPTESISSTPLTFLLKSKSPLSFHLWG